MLANACSSSGPWTPWTLARTSASRFGTKMGAESPPPLVCPTRSETSARSCSRCAIWLSRASIRARKSAIESGSAGTSGVAWLSAGVTAVIVRRGSHDRLHCLNALLQAGHDLFGSRGGQSKDAPTHALASPVIDATRVGSQPEYGDWNRVPTRLFGQARKLRNALVNAGRVSPSSNRHPFVAVVEYALERVRTVAADDDRRMWLLDRFGPLPDAVEVHEVTVKIGLFVGPELLHGQDPLAHELPAAVGIGAVIGHLLQVPAAAHAEQKASARQVIQRGHLFGGGDRIALDHQAHPRAKAELAGHRGRGGQSQKRVKHVRVLAWELCTAGPRGAPLSRDVRVLWYPQRLESLVFGGAGQVDDRDRVLGWEDKYAKLHC